MVTAQARRKSGEKPAARVSALLGLQKVELFKGLETATLREIAQQCTWTRCKRNAVVIRREGTDRDVYFVISGMVRMAAPSARGRSLILRDVPAGEVFGELSAIDGRSRFADVLSVRESLLASMPADAFRAILAKHPSVRERLLRRLTGSVRALAARLLGLRARACGASARARRAARRRPRPGGTPAHGLRRRRRRQQRPHRACAEPSRNCRPRRHGTLRGYARAFASCAPRPARTPGPARARPARCRRARAARRWPNGPPPAPPR